LFIVPATAKKRALQRRRLASGSRLMGNRVPAFMDGLSILAGGLILVSLGWLLFNWRLAYCSLLLCARLLPMGSFAVGVQPGRAGAGVPPSTRFHWCVRLALVSALSLFVDNPSQSTAMALTAHAIHYVLTGIPGGYALFRDGESLSGLYQKARSMR
jgi:hypothetical protein